MASLDIPAQLTAKQGPLYNDFLQKAQSGPSPQAATAAHAFLQSLPRLNNDLWMSRVINLAVQHPQIDFQTLGRLIVPGPLCAAQLHDVHARRFRFAEAERYQSAILGSASEGGLGLQELSLVSIRALLHDEGLLSTAQIQLVGRAFPSDQRESLPAGSGIWLAARATVKALAPALAAIVDNPSTPLDQVKLVLISPDGQINDAVLEVAKRFRTAVLVKYQSQAELVQRLRELKMRVVIELHGLQNPASFIEDLRTGVANVQLTWAGLPESCPVPFIDGQLLDPVLAQSPQASCRAIPLRCWLPPVAKNYPALVRGDAIGVWAMPGKITRRFLQRCSSLANREKRKLQIYIGQAINQLADLPEGVEIVATLDEFRPSVLLDTSPLSGGHACLFALLSGIPVVTLPGEGISSRLGASILLNYGFPQGVAKDHAHYEELVASFIAMPKLPNIARHISWEFAETIQNHFGGA